MAADFDIPTRIARRFVRDEEGAMTIFSILMTVLILAITGAAVDIMRQEAVRAQMQATLDRAVLAATDLDQTQPPDAVVRDYVDRAGMSSTLASVSVDDGINYRTVTAQARTAMDTVFMRIMGYDSLDTPALAAATERVPNVEISMVLDVSGSMRGSRIANLQNAANEFIDTVIQPEGSPGLTTVSIVPYNATVNVGESLAPYFNLSDEHGYSHCAVFLDAAFDRTAVWPHEPLDRLSHFQMFNSNESGTGLTDPWCNTGDGARLVIHSNDKAALRNHIRDFAAAGNTAIDLGMKWGVALLDPAMRTVVSALALDTPASAVLAQAGSRAFQQAPGLSRAMGEVPFLAADRPAGFDETEVIKFVVVMTDGQNTSQYDLAPQFRQGMSEIWVDDRGTATLSDDRYSLRVQDNNGNANDLYFWERFENRSWDDRYRNRPDGGWNGARQLSNAELFARFPMQGLARRMYTQPYYDRFVSYGQWYEVYQGYSLIAGNSEANDRLSRICRAARDKGIVVFAIGFEAPQDGQRAMRDCASSPSHYFDVSGADITETFHAIARQINALRLIQ